MKKSTGPLYAFGGAHPNALERNKNAMTGLATGLKTERPQDILTPQVVVDFVTKLWDAPILTDPCATRDLRNLVEAEFRFYGDGPNEDGLKTTWTDRTYVNPPFKYLKDWMAHAAIVGASAKHPRIALLAPTRGHRTWWHTCRDTCSRVLELHSSFKFVGYDQAFPAPLSLLLWGDVGHDVLLVADAVGLRTTKVSYL